MSDTPTCTTRAEKGKQSLDKSMLDSDHFEQPVDKGDMVAQLAKLRRDECKQWPKEHTA
jgi:hypothetical protein